MTNEFERMWKEAVVACYPSICLEGLRKNCCEAAVRTAGVGEEIRTEHLLNTSLDMYRCVNPLSRSFCPVPSFSILYLFPPFPAFPSSIALLPCFSKNRDGSSQIANRLRAGQAENWRPVPRRDRGVCILHSTHTGSGSYPRVPGIKRQKREADSSPPPSVQVKTHWIYTSIPPTHLHGMVIS
jgi:hypothetical protein